MTAPVGGRGALPGRERERALFTRELETAAQGRPRLLLLEGEPGIGRSALLAEIEASPLLPGSRIRVVRVDLRDRSDADPVVLAARAASRYGLYERLGGRRRVGGLARKLLPEWIGAIPGAGDLLEAVVATAEAIRKRRGGPGPNVQARAEDVEALIAVARRRPLALLIDDLHACGEDAVERVRRLVADAEVGVRLLVVATCRAPRLGAPRHAVHRLPERLPADRIAFHRMEPLSGEEVGEWLGDRWTGGAAAAVLDTLMQETGGVPAALVDCLDRLGDPDSLSAEDAAGLAEQFAAGPDGAGEEVALPEAVTAALRSAAALPPEFDALALAGLIGEDELEVEDRLAVAVRAGALVNLGIAELDNGELSTRFRFTSSALRARFHRSAAARTAAVAEPAEEDG